MTVRSRCLGLDRAWRRRARTWIGPDRGSRTSAPASRAVSPRSRRPRGPPSADRATVIAARRLNRAAGTLAVSVLADSAIEHYRGSFKNKAMFTPLVVSALTLATSIHGTSDTRPAAHLYARYDLRRWRPPPASSAPAFIFITLARRPAASSWQNLFYARAAWRAFGDSAVRPHRFLLGARARYAALADADDLRSSGRPSHGRGDERGASGHDRRGRADAFPRRLPQSVHDVAGHAAARRRAAVGDRRRLGRQAAISGSRAGGCGC